MMTTKSPAKLTKAEVFALEMVMTTAMENQCTCDGVGYEGHADDCGVHMDRKWYRTVQKIIDRNKK